MSSPMLWRNSSQASHSGDYIEGKLVTAVDELKVPDCGNATEETEKDAKVDKSDYIDDDTNDLDKLRWLW